MYVYRRTLANRNGDAKFELERYELAQQTMERISSMEESKDLKRYLNELLEDGIRCLSISPNMKEGYPGSLLSESCVSLC